MKTKFTLATLVASALLALCSVAHAQSAPAVPPTKPVPATAAAEDRIKLSPFVVNTSKDNGYVAASSLSGGRTDTPLALTPASISVMTREFFDDLNITSSEFASQWAVNSIVAEDGKNSFFNVKSSTTRASRTTPTRNYFPYNAFTDAFMIERLEFGRGPNALLMGDSSAGGTNTVFTKVAKFGLQRHEARLQGDSYGGQRATFDTNWGNDRFAIRLNGLTQRGKGWRDNDFENRDAVHLTASYEISPSTQLRAETEYFNRKQLIFSTVYVDYADGWDRKTVNADNTTIAGDLVRLGVGQFGGFQVGVGQVGANYFVYSPAVPSAGVQNWSTSYRTSGSILHITPDGRSDVPNSARLPSREFSLGPVNSVAQEALRNTTIYLDQRITENWFVQLSYFQFRNLNRTLNGDLQYNGYWIDINKLLPSGQPNPKFGVGFKDELQQRQFQSNFLQNYRVLTSYKFAWQKAFDLKQRFVAIADYRPEIFNTKTEGFRRVDNPTVPNLADARNQVRVRLYFDEPMRYSLPNTGFIPGQTFDWRETGFGTMQRKKLKDVQISSTTHLFKERVALIVGVRRDQVENNYQNGADGNITVDPVFGTTRYGGFNPATKTYVLGGRTIEKTEVTSKNGGGVVYVLPWLAAQANYSESFSLPSAGFGKIDGSSLGAPQTKGNDLGLKFNLPGGKLYATFTHYRTKILDNIVGNTVQPRIRDIWTALGSTDEAKTSISYRDTSNDDLSGWEAEIVANPLPNLRLTANFGLPTSKFVSANPGERAYVAANRAEWEAGARSTTLAGASSIATNLATIDNAFAGKIVGTTANGTFKHLTNFYGTYDFREGSLKGLAFGAGVNWRGPRKVGSRDPRLKFNLAPTATATIAQARAAAFDYMYAPSALEAATHVSYYFRASGKIRARVQLNVSNLFDNLRIQHNTYQTINQGGIAGNPLIETFGNFLMPAPRKFTLGTTVTF